MAETGNHTCACPACQTTNLLYTHSRANIRTKGATTTQHHLLLTFLFTEGRAHLVDANTVEVALSSGGTRRLRTKNVLIATGGIPSKLNIPGAVRTRPTTRDIAMELGVGHACMCKRGRAVEASFPRRVP